MSDGGECRKPRTMRLLLPQAPVLTEVPVLQPDRAKTSLLKNRFIWTRGACVSNCTKRQGMLVRTRIHWALVPSLSLCPLTPHKALISCPLSTLHAFAHPGKRMIPERRVRICCEIRLTGFPQRLLPTYPTCPHMRASRECSTQGNCAVVRGRSPIRSLKGHHARIFCLGALNDYLKIKQDDFCKTISSSSSSTSSSSIGSFLFSYNTQSTVHSLGKLRRHHISSLPT